MVVRYVSDVSVLFSEPKIPQFQSDAAPTARVRRVSVLFSEPKIPQFETLRVEQQRRRLFQCSSASRKFLNVWSTPNGTANCDVSVLFSEPKIPQFFEFEIEDDDGQRFSALQRAENSSIASRFSSAVCASSFQCSSASRKFLNSFSASSLERGSVCFSALQRAENSPIAVQSTVQTALAGFSALQRAENSSIAITSVQF